MIDHTYLYPTDSETLELVMEYAGLILVAVFVCAMAFCKFVGWL